MRTKTTPPVPPLGEGVGGEGHKISREEIVRISEAVLAMPDHPLKVGEDVFRIRVAEMDWDIGGMVYEPRDSALVPTGADGKRVGLFLLHGGAGDHRSKDRMARFIAARYGYKVASMTFPGKLNLLDPSRDWPGDTMHSDGTARTPLWSADSPITPDQYELIQDRSDAVKRAKWGTLFFLRAKEGTEFYYRLAAWPLAFEEAMKEVCRRNFRPDAYSIYLHGHSTGGPFVHMLLQRVENVAGLLGAESSPWGQLYARMLGMSWEYPFNYLTLRTWRHIAKYAGPEAGPDGAWRLPWLMEDVFEAWERVKGQPQFKAEYFVTYAALDALAEAAQVTASRLGMGVAERRELVKRYHGYTRELSGPGVRPVPPLLYGIARGSRDHTEERYRRVLLPALAALDPPPRARLVVFEAGVHGYEKPEDGLPRGILPAVTQTWHDAITGGYFAAEAQSALSPSPSGREQVRFAGSG